MDLKKYRELFISEAEEYLQQIYDLLQRLETGHAEKDLVVQLMSNTHSIKGMARTVGFSDIEALSHKLEDFIQQLPDNNTIESTVITHCYEGFELLEQMIANAKADSPQKIDCRSFLEKLETRPSADQPEGSATTKMDFSPQLKKTSYARVKTETLDAMLNNIGEILICRNRLKTICKPFASRELKTCLYQMNEIVRELHLQITIARMTPIKILTDRVKRFIRSMAAPAGKEIAFKVVGENTEMDRALIEGLEEPLMHIVRNSVDHGIEAAQEREKKKKPKGGTITLTISRTKEKALIQVEDDGRGIEPDLVKQRALEKGLLTQKEAENMSPEDSLMLIFSPGFSTAEKITETSGRGVGMNIVKNKIGALGGSITLYSQVGVGSRFVFSLPLTVSIMPALIVRIDTYFFAIPITKVVSNVRIVPEEIFFQKQKKSFTFRTTPIPLFPLNTLLKLDPPARNEEGHLSVVVAEISNRMIGLVVDEFIGHQEIVVKPLKPPLHNITVFSGITLLGNGEITFVLNLEGLKFCKEKGSHLHMSINS